MPNTYMFHIGGGNGRPSISRNSQLTLARMRNAVPKYSYIGETATPTSGQVGMNFVAQNGRTPTLGEMIKASKMSTTDNQPLSANSTNMLLSEKNGALRYTNEYMPMFNKQSLSGRNNVTEELLKANDINTTNTFLLQSNPNARTSFVGIDGKLKIPIPINFKIK